MHRNLRLALLPAMIGWAACGRAQPEAAAAPDTPPPPGVTLRLDFAGAEALDAALDRQDLTDAGIDSLLAVPGLAAMVDNVTRFVPGVGRAEFRGDLRAFAASRRGDANDDYFQLRDAWRERRGVRALLAAIRSDRANIERRTLSVLGPYAPDTGPLAITAYFVAGGVSDGFVFDDRADPAFYANLVRAQGDFGGTVANMAHEAYHVMQKAAQRRAGLARYADSSEALPLPDRLLTVTLAEGTANYVVSPARWQGDGPALDDARARYRRNAEPARVRANFAAFDSVLADLAAGRITWDEAYGRGFTGDADARFYFVGYEMAKAIEADCGAACIGRLFAHPPRDFFRQYVTLSHARPGLTRFAPATEAYLTSGNDR